MNKEELEKEAEEKAFSYAQLIPCSPYMEKRHREIDFKEGYFAGAEPREKQIRIDAKQIRALQKQNGELTDKVKELEVQIEKMKCCANCEYTPPFDKHCDNCIQGRIKLKYRNWKLRR